MNPLRIASMTLFAMLAFAGNSILCRLALKQSGIDAASFTTIRLCSGALLLCLIVWLRGAKTTRPSLLRHGSWWSALALFVYAAGFSFAYLHLTASTGALMLFGAVQVTMIAVGIWRGERLSALQTLGLLAAFAGLVGLLLPGLSAPPLLDAVLMLLAGVAWGVYSLRGKGSQQPIALTAGNFLRATAFTGVLSLVLWQHSSFSSMGVWLAIASGALTSALGYSVWYGVLPFLKSTTAATVQLCVPLLTAVIGILFLQEPLSLRLVLASVVTLGGVALVIFAKPKAA